MFVPAAPCTWGVRARAYLSALPARARSHPPTPINLHLRPTHLRSHSRMRKELAPGPTRPCLESAPFSTRSCPTRSRFYQRAHAADCTGDQYAPVVISRWRPLQPHASLAVYKPVRAPS
jgi:hypothetical protein